MIHSNLSFDDYTALPGINQSKLALLKSCPQKFKFFSEHERKDSDALIIGRAIHTAVFQPELFNAEFLCLPDIDRRTAKGKEQYAELVSQNPDKTVLKPADFNRAMEIATAVRTNRHVLNLIEGAHAELSITWVDADTDVPCKARLDCWNEELGIVVDLKTTLDASLFGFPKKLYAYGYHRQAAWYLQSLRANGESAKHFVFIAVEKEPPYSLGIYRLSDDAIRLSKAENEALLRKYCECVRTDSWPGYTDGIEDISIPEYAINTMEENYGIEESI
jgi:exodeoxyribonuclease VIII